MNTHGRNVLKQSSHSGTAQPLPATTTRQWVLQNDALRLRLTAGNGAVLAKAVEHRQLGQTLTLPPEEFRFEFNDRSTMASGSLALRTVAATGRELDLLFADSSGFEVRVRYTLTRQAHYLRKHISIRTAHPSDRRLLRADLENWQGVARNWNSMRADTFPYGSHPVFCDDLWAGVEFVAAFNDYGPDGFTLRSRPGGARLTTAWLDLHATVVGVAPTGKVRDAFLRYLEDIRLAPARMVACYNSWWTLPKVVKQRDNLALIKQLKTDMFERHGVFFDVITTDMGWSNPRSIWEIDASVLPRGFDDIRELVESAGGQLGLWMSPSEIYPPVCDYDWAEKNGYVVVRPEPDLPSGKPRTFQIPGLSLADPKYREETKVQLQKLIRANGLGHIKFDGFWPVEYHAHHDLLPEADSVEPLAAHALELLQAAKAANPQLVTEPTMLNSITSYISPWLLQYSDTIWANAVDCVVGIGPAPDYRESHTNAREFIVFQSLDQVWLPQDAVHYFDIVHVDASEGFPNHAAMAFGRGRFFLSTYLNPKLMSDDDWRIYTGLLRWARGNTDLLRHTRVLRSRVELGEPYLYAHWLGTRGILVVRNPSNETQNFTIDLGEAGAPAGRADGICYSQYPYRRGIAAGLTGQSRMLLKLAPWELLYLEVVPQPLLVETVVIGARWYRAADGTTTIAADAEAEYIQLIGPGRSDRIVVVPTRSRAMPAGRVVSHTVTPLPENEWLAGKPRTTPLFPFKYPAEFNAETLKGLRETAWKDIAWTPAPSVAFELDCSAQVPDGASACQLLLLVEYPGRGHCSSRCTAWVDGSEAVLDVRHSDEHVGFHNWTDSLRAVESEWTWYICDVPVGSHRIKFSGRTGHAGPRLGVWLWVDYDLADQTLLTAVQCRPPVLPQYRDRRERHGICLLRPAVVRVMECV